jgi:hypothetical protein
VILFVSFAEKSAATALLRAVPWTNCWRFSAGIPEDIVFLRDILGQHHAVALILGDIAHGQQRISG